MKIFLISILLLNISFATNIRSAFAIGIFDEDGNGENIQHIRKTNRNYNGTCFSKVFVNGNYGSNTPMVKIGNSIGHLQSTKSIYNKYKIKTGEVLLFKHYGVKSGYIKVWILNKLYDSRVFIK